MQRFVFALVALISLLLVNIRPAPAQGHAPAAVEPAAPSQETSGHGSAASADETASESHARIPEGAVYVPPGETVENVTAHNKPVIIEGNVTHDVHAVNSKVQIGPNARIGGRLVTSGGTVDIEPGLVLSSGPTEESRPVVAPPAPQETRAVQPHAPQKKEDWFGGQVALLMLGAVGGLVMLIAAPFSTQQVSKQVAQEPARCLAIGAIGAVGMVAVLFVSTGLRQTPLGLLWAPFHFVIALIPVLALVFGWLCGMRFAGDLIARKFAHNYDPGKLYNRMALGLVTFFLVNVVLGSLSYWMGGVSLLIEFLVALMGVGAMLITGLGSDSDWLTRRMHGETRWFSWGRRP